MKSKLISSLLTFSMVFGFAAAVPQATVGAVDDASETVYKETEKSAATYAASSDSSEITIGGDWLLDDSIKYQFKNNGDTIRFVWICDEKTFAKATKGTVDVRVMNYYDDSTLTINVEEITHAYKTIYAGGKQITAPDGKLYILSSEYSGLSKPNWSALGIFDLDSLRSVPLAGMYLDDVGY